MRRIEIVAFVAANAFSLNIPMNGEASKEQKRAEQFPVPHIETNNGIGGYCFAPIIVKVKDV